MPRSRGIRGFGTRPIRSISGGASNAAWRSSASASLIQLTSRARARGSYGCSTSCPRAGKPCANPGAAISAGCPRRWPPWDCISRAAASSPSPIRGGQVRTGTCRRRASTPGGVARRGTNLDDRLHPPDGHVRPRRPTGELVDLALEAVSRPCPLPACAKPNRAAHGFHRRLDPCDRPAGRTDPAMFVVAPAPSRSCASGLGGTRAPQSSAAPLRRGGQRRLPGGAHHGKSLQRSCWAGAIPIAVALGEAWAFQETKAAEGLELSTVCMAIGTASVIESIFSLQIEDIFRRFDA